MANRPHEIFQAGKSLAGGIDRRELMKRAAAVGVSAPAMAAILGGGGRLVSATATQDQTGLVTVSPEGTSTFIRSFNPLIPGQRWPTAAGIHEPLAFRNQVTNELTPWLAESWEFGADNLTLTFALRDGVLWSDGRPFTARDVEFTFGLLAANEGLAGSGAIRAVLPFVESVSADGDASVVVTFKEVFTPGLYDIAGQAIVPMHIWQDIADPVTYTNETPVGTGPFTEVTTFQAQYYEVRKNPNYWQEGKPYVEGFRVPAHTGNDSLTLAAANGEIDWAGSFIPNIEQTFVARDPEHHKYWYPGVGSAVCLHMNHAVKPFDDANVRKAISMALNREQICELAMYGYANPADATGLSDGYADWKSAEAVQAGQEFVTYSVDAANALLDKAGYARSGDTRTAPDGTPLQFELIVAAGFTDYVQATQIIVQNLKEIGIAATMASFDAAVWETMILEGDYQASIRWTSSGATPFNFYRAAMSSATFVPVGQRAVENFHRYQNEEADALLAEFAATSDQAEQLLLTGELQMLFVTEFPMAPLFPGPAWGWCNTARFEGFPTEDDPYALLQIGATESLLVMTTITPVQG